MWPHLTCSSVCSAALINLFVLNTRPICVASFWKRTSTDIEPFFILFQSFHFPTNAKANTAVRHHPVPPEPIIAGKRFVLLLLLSNGNMPRQSGSNLQQIWAPTWQMSSTLPTMSVSSASCGTDVNEKIVPIAKPPCSGGTHYAHQTTRNVSKRRKHTFCLPCQ